MDSRGIDDYLLGTGAAGPVPWEIGEALFGIAVSWMSPFPFPFPLPSQSQSSLPLSGYIWFKLVVAPDTGTYLSALRFWPQPRRSLQGVSDIHPSLRCLIAALTLGFSLHAFAAGVTIQTRIGPAFADARVDAPLGSKVFNDDKRIFEVTVALILGGALDLFGIVDYRTTGDFDPYNAFSIQVTNLRPDPQPIELQVISDIFPTASPNTLELHLDVEVRDTNSAGGANFDAGTAFAGAINTATFSLVPFAVNNAYALTPGAATTVIDLDGPGPEFAPFGVTTIDQLFMAITGTLSPGDTVELNGFQCIFEPGGECPTPPNLRFSIVPLPAPGFLMLVGLASFLRFRRLT